MKTKKAKREEKPASDRFLFPCGDFEKMAEMMKTFCPDEGQGIGCCSMMRRMMGRGRTAGTKKAE